MLEKKRDLTHLELMRIIAIFLVLFNHTNESGFLLYSVSWNSLLFPLYLFMSIACKVAVPLFFMISGALLLGKEETIGEVYRKRVLRMVIILIIISIVYQAYDCLVNGETFSLSTFLEKFYGSNLSTALWYMYVYIAMLMMMPILRRLAQHMKAHEYVYLAVMSLIFVGVIPILEFLIGQDSLTLTSDFQVPLFVAVNVIFFLMGYFFEHILSEKYYTWKFACIGIIFSLVAIGISCYMTVYRADVTGDYTAEVFHNSLIAIPAYTIYFCIKLLFMKEHVPMKLQKVIQIAGGTVFGIFLLERILREVTEPVFTWLKPYIHTMPACLIWILAACLLGFVVVLLLKQIPILFRKIWDRNRPSESH